jgi:hypothetical protein
MLWIGGLECVAGKAHTAQVRLGIPIFNSTLSALHNGLQIGNRFNVAYLLLAVGFIHK